MFYQQKFLVGKILQLFFFGYSISMAFLCLGIVKKKNEKQIFIAVLLKSLNSFIYDEFYTKNYKTIFFGTIAWKYTFRDVGMELPI